MGAWTGGGASAWEGGVSGAPNVAPETVFQLALKEGLDVRESDSFAATVTRHNVNPTHATSHELRRHGVGA